MGISSKNKDTIGKILISWLMHINNIFCKFYENQEANNKIAAKVHECIKQPT